MQEGVEVSLDALIALRTLARKSGGRLRAKADRAGLHASRFRGRGMEFAEVRNYQAGDEIRHMDWRVTARMGRPHVKQYEEARERPVILVVDFNPGMFFGTRGAFKSVVAARLAAAMAWSARFQGDRIGALLSAPAELAVFPPRMREAALLPMLAALSRHTRERPSEWQAPRPLKDALSRLLRVIRPGSLVVLVSDFMTLDAECDKLLYRLRAHNSLMACQVLDAMEVTLPEAGCYPVTDGLATLNLDLASKSGRKRFAEAMHAQQESVRSRFLALGIPYVQVDAQTSIAHFLRTHFPGRGRGGS